MTEITNTWAELMPHGRNIFYEGEDPQGFVEEIKSEFGFDPSADELWGVFYPETPSGDDSFTSFQFHCPAERLDAVYGSGRWPMGS